LLDDARGDAEVHLTPRTPEYLWRTVHGATVPGYASVVVRRMAMRFRVRAGRALRRREPRSDTHPAPAVGSPGGADQDVAKFAHFGCLGSFVERCGDVLRCTSHLVYAIG